MLRRIIRTVVLFSASYGAYQAARRYWGSDFDHAVDSAKSTLKDIGSDFARKDKAVNNRIDDVASRAV